MKLIGWMLLASLVIAAAQAIATALVLALLLGVVCCLYRAPRETFALAGLCIVANVVLQQPLVLAVLVGVALIGWIWAAIYRPSGT